jgi:zinc transport system ATP-binding protein
MATPIIELKDVNVRFGENIVLDTINLKVFEQDFVGLIGPNGAGKTVLLKVILGLLAPTTGTVKVLDTSARAAHGMVGYVPQFARFDAKFPISVLDVVMSGRLAHVAWYQRFSAEDHEKAKVALSKVELSDLAHRQIGALSGGQIQRVLIARALAVEPKVLLLDEPTASLDSKIGTGVYQLLGELSKDMAIVLVSHDVGMISGHVKTIACLNRKLHYHHDREISTNVLEEVYGCPFDLVAHGHAHRVLPEHS